ncbi:chromatin accessibility complex protein 1-like [Hydractinia symbiolongicarpus]|uniref:chromatin accessibility complex protein 1-like n=1 Tax=Hydractinia symbiolongicarpus TaxID=13093 RepID=UPI00254C2AE8|nr:chromatin accessibility complex protein 1-like [Hydractinia symbiolongicarpus]
MTSSDTEQDDKGKTPNKLLQLPMARVKTIMRSSPDLGNVSQEGYYMITKATELFVQYLAQKAYAGAQKENFVDYNSLSKLVQTDESLEFLEEIVPPKIKAWEYWKKIGYSPEKEEKTKKSPPKKVTTPSTKSPRENTTKSPRENTTKSPTVKSPSGEKPIAMETIVID